MKGLRPGIKNQRSANYYANTLNQYTNRTVPGYVDVKGISIATDVVTVNGQTAYRKFEYFRSEVPVTNGVGAISTNITVPAGWDALPPGVQPRTPIGQ